MNMSDLYSKIIYGLLFPVLSFTSELFREETFTWTGTSTVKSSILVTKEISLKRITTVWCNNECRKIPGCRGIEFCNSGNNLCRLWNGPFDHQMAAVGSHSAECNRFSKEPILTSGMMTESDTMISTDLMPTIDTITEVNVKTPGTTPPFIDTATQQLTTSKEDTATSGASTTTKEAIQIDLTTADTTSSVDSTKISVDSTSVDATTSEESTTVGTTTSVDSNRVDTSTSVDILTVDTITQGDTTTVDTITSIDSTRIDATNIRRHKHS